VRVVCRVVCGCSPAIRLTWIKVNGRLPIGRYEMNHHNTELLIKDVRKSDEGDYKCTASNSNGRDHVVVQIDVQCTLRCLALACGPVYVKGPLNWCVCV